MVSVVMVTRLVFAVVLITSTTAHDEIYKLCTTDAYEHLCTGNDKIRCHNVEYTVDCALKLERDEVQFAVFSEEEMMLLAQMQPHAHKVVASRRMKENRGQLAFETVAVVSTSHTGGLEGLRQGGYCHPGVDPIEVNKSPRVLKTLEREIARIEGCSEADKTDKILEELEVSILSKFFRAACRPGRWSLHYADDDRLKREYSNLCTLCRDNGTSDCSGGYRYGAEPDYKRSTHALALDCLTEHGGTVAYVEWRHASEYFLQEKPELISNYALLCPDNTLVPLTRDILNSKLAACAWVQQPWGAVVASTHRAAGILAEMKTWWPSGDIRDSNTFWEHMMFYRMAGVLDDVLVYQDALPSAFEYVSSSRNLADIDVTSFCMPTQRWCTISEDEQRKCEWVRHALRTLGVEPALSCQRGQSPLHCLRDIRDNNADFIAIDSNYGYLARHIFDLSPLLMVNHWDKYMTRVAALVRSNSGITRFENLRGKKACFPEFGGIAFLSFVATGHNKSILSTSECNYAKAVAEFFKGTCAPGALDSMRQLYNSSFDVSSLCDVCKSPYPAAGNGTDFTCKTDWTNMYYGNDGALTCLADQSADVAFVDVRDLDDHLARLNIPADTFRPLCSGNNSLGKPGTFVNDDCLMSQIINSEVMVRRNDSHLVSLTSLLNNLKHYIGHGVPVVRRLIDLQVCSTFDGIHDLLFKDSVDGLFSPSFSRFSLGRDYFQLLEHLDSCTGSVDSLFSNGVFSHLSLVFVSLLSIWLF